MTKCICHLSACHAVLQRLGRHLCLADKDDGNVCKPLSLLSLQVDVFPCRLGRKKVMDLCNLVKLSVFTTDGVQKHVQTMYEMKFRSVEAEICEW